MAKNTYSQAQKKEICDKHRRLVRLIYRIGFEKMLQQQVITIALMFGYYQNERDVKNAIQELEKYQIIKKIQTINNNKFLILCKYARAYIRGIDDSQKVAAFDSDMSKANQFDRIARVQLFINHVKARKYTKFKEIKSYNTFTTREDLTHEFYEKILKLKHPQFNQDNLQELMNKSISDSNFKPSQVPEDYKSKQKTQFNLNNDTVTLRQLIQKKIYIENITQNQTHITFTFDLVDANNRYTPKKFKENVLYVEKFVHNIVQTGYGLRQINIEVNYICTDQDKLESIKHEMNHRVWDNKNARYKGESRLQALEPRKVLESINIHLRVNFKVLESSYFKSF